jgi:hypothetical protein
MLKIFTNNRYYLVHSKPLKIKNIVDLLHKKFRTKHPRFNQNHSYGQFWLI